MVYFLTDRILYSPHLFSSLFYHLEASFSLEVVIPLNRS